MLLHRVILIKRISSSSFGQEINSFLVSEEIHKYSPFGHDGSNVWSFLPLDISFFSFRAPLPPCLMIEYTELHLVVSCCFERFFLLSSSPTTFDVRVRWASSCRVVLFRAFLSFELLSHHVWCSSTLSFVLSCRVVSSVSFFWAPLPPRLMFEYAELHLVVSCCFERFFLLSSSPTTFDVRVRWALFCGVHATNFLVFCLARILEYYRMDFEGPCVWCLPYSIHFSSRPPSALVPQGQCLLRVKKNSIFSMVIFCFPCFGSSILSFTRNCHLVQIVRWLDCRGIGSFWLVSLWSYLRSSRIEEPMCWLDDDRFHLFLVFASIGSSFVSYRGTYG